MFLRASSSRTKTMTISMAFCIPFGTTVLRRVASDSRTTMMAQATHIITTCFVTGRAIRPRWSVGRWTSPTNGSSSIWESPMWWKIASPASNALGAPCSGSCTAFILVSTSRLRLQAPQREADLDDLEEDVEAQERRRGRRDVDPRPQRDVDQGRAVQQQAAQDPEGQRREEPPRVLVEPPAVQRHRGDRPYGRQARSEERSLGGGRAHPLTAAARRTRVHPARARSRRPRPARLRRTGPRGRAAPGP